MRYDINKRVFMIDDPPDMLLKYIDKDGHIPEIYWGSLKYCYETTRCREVGLALKEFQETLQVCGIPPVGWSNSWGLDDIPKITQTGTRLRNYQLKAVHRLARGSLILGDGMGLGKQHPVDTLICTPAGWAPIGSLRPGHEVIGSDGKPTKVTGVFPQGVKPSYRVEFSDGAGVEAGPEHLWSVEFLRGGRTRERITLTTDQLRLRPIIDRPAGKKMDLARTTLSLPMLSGPVQFRTTPLPIPPYTLGQLISNGSLGGTTVRLTVNNYDWPEVLASLWRDGIEISRAKEKPGCIAVGIPNMIMLTRALGLNVKSGRKFIPVEYMRGKPEDRIALLHGLMDGDGSCSATNSRLTYHTTSLTLAKDIVELVQCLGGIASYKQYSREGKADDYSVRIRMPHGIPPFRCKRKLERYKPGRLALPTRTVTSVSYVRDVESVCISVEAEDRLYLTENAILTHNTLAALWTWWNLGGMYLGQRNLTVITPSDDVADEWRRAAIQHLGYRGLVTIRDRGDLEEARSAPAIAIPYCRFWRTDYRDLLMDRLSKHGEDQHPILVLDEAHRISRTTSQQHSHIWQVVRDNPRALVWALSGTEVSNTPDGYYGLYRIITRSHLPEIAWKDFVQDVWTKEWKENRLKQIRVLRRGFALRRTVDDVGMELPPLTEVTCLVDMDPVQRDIYNEIRRDQTLTVVKDGQEQCTSITHFWTANIRLTQVASHPLLVNDDRIVGSTPKFDRLVDIIQDSDRQDKVIIWSNFPRVIEWIATELRNRFPGYKVVTASGQVSKENRQVAKDSFQAGEVDILVANPAVWSEGVNLIPGRTMVYWDYSPSRVQWEQSRKRSHRMGQTRPVTIYKLVTRDSIEQKWCRWLLRKATLADLISGKG